MDEHQELSVYIKAEEILELTQAIVDSIDEEDDELHLRELMMSNAMLIPAKIAGAEGGDIYSLRMENAVLIKIAARELLASTSQCKMLNLSRPDYLQVLRDEIENFRIIFLDWVNSFDRLNDLEDDWKIFD